jgi:hypothetical protein
MTEHGAQYDHIGSKYDRQREVSQTGTGWAPITPRVEHQSHAAMVISISRPTRH